MNGRVANFINSHEEEIDTNDFHAVFTAAHNELNNDDTKVLFLDLSDTFDPVMIQKQRETALYFLVSMIVEDMDFTRRYTFSYIYETLMHYNILGLKPTEFVNYLADNLEEFGLIMKPFNGATIFYRVEE